MTTETRKPKAVVIEEAKPGVFNEKLNTALENGYELSSSNCSVIHEEGSYTQDLYQAILVLPSKRDLRDKFAMAALASFEEGETHIDYMAEVAYHIADAMLMIRNKE